MDKLKLKYFYYHSLASLSIVISLCLICLFVWFPSPFFKLDGTWLALITLAFIDITIGPILTILLLSSKKSMRENIVDLTVIASIQISALSYGFIQISQERIYALIYLNGVFNPVPIKEITLNKTLELPNYKGVYYGTAVKNKERRESKKPLLYSTKNYRPLSFNTIGNDEFIYSKLPLYIQKKYNHDYIFKVLPGKKGVAIVILNLELVIQEIVLL